MLCYNISLYYLNLRYGMFDDYIKPHYSFGAGLMHYACTISSPNMGITCCTISCIVVTMS